MGATIGGHWNWIHIVLTFLLSGTGFGFLAHMVNTFPVPDNPYGRWLLSGLQWYVGQRERAINTSNNHDTVTVATTKRLTVP